MENRLEEAKATVDKPHRVRIALLAPLRERVGAWLIIQGAKVAGNTPKVA